MDYTLYTSYLGMRARMRTLEVIAGNIANASSTGYKADRMVYRSVETAEIEALRKGQERPATEARPMGVLPGGGPPPNSAPNPAADGGMQASRALGVTTGSLMDYSTGSMRQTGRALDVALAGDGLLTVQTPRGERYTRNGGLTLDAAGQLVTLQGDLVVGEEGPITVRPGEISIGEDGSVYSGRDLMGKLKIVRFDDPRKSLQKEGASYFAAATDDKPQPATETRVMQGSLESSNVNAIDEMVAMMQNNRELESLQRSLSQIMAARKAASEIGRI